MNSFEIMNQQGLEVQEIVKAHLEKGGYKVQDVSQDRAYQKKDVDFVLYSKTGNTATMEVKKDKSLYRTGNIFVECGFQRGDYYSRGWIQYCEADFLCYYDTTAAKGIIVNRGKLLPLLEQGKKITWWDKMDGKEGTAILLPMEKAAAGGAIVHQWED